MHIQQQSPSQRIQTNQQSGSKLNDSQQIYKMTLQMDYLNDDDNLSNKELLNDMQAHFEDQNIQEQIQQEHGVYASISKDLKHTAITDSLQAAYSANDFSTLTQQLSQQLLFIMRGAGVVNTDLSLTSNTDYQKLKNSVLTLKVAMQAMYVQGLNQDPNMRISLDALVIALCKISMMETVLRNPKKCPIICQNEKINAITICENQSTVGEILLNLLREPNLLIAKNSAKITDNPNKHIKHQLYYDQISKQHHQVVDGKTINLTVRYEDSNGNSMTQSELFKAKIQDAGKIHGTISWNKLNKYFKGCKRPADITPPARGYEVLNENKNECNDEFHGALIKVLKQQGRDQILMTSHAGQDYYFYYSDKDNNLKYIECDKPQTPIEIEQALKCLPAHEVFSDILIARIAQGTSPKAMIVLPKELVNYQASQTPLILKHGLNLSADLFDGTQIGENIILELNQAVPESCIQHTEFLLRKVQGDAYSFEYNKEAAGTDEAPHGLDIYGSYTDINNTAIRINFSKDSILDVLENNPI